MQSIHRSLALAGIVAFAFQITPATAQPKKRPAPATQDDIARLEKKLEEQQKMIDKLVALQKQYLVSLHSILEGTGTATTPTAPVSDTTPPTDPSKPPDATKPADTTPTRVNPTPVATKPTKPKTAGVGTIVGKIAGAADAIVYVDGFATTGRGAATMKQEGKAFIPSTLVVQKGTTVQFPNRDAIFHNVFSVTPDNSFDLGSYRQGESKSVTMSKPGVVTVYCNMHPQMVGHILVVPNGNYVRAGKDGFFRLTNVPAGTHKVVAWAPNAKPVSVQANVADAEVVTVELELKKGKSSPHTKKDGLPYGSYEK